MKAKKQSTSARSERTKKNEQLAERREGGDRRAPRVLAPMPIQISSIGLRDIAFRELRDPSHAVARGPGLPISQIKVELDAVLDFPESQIVSLTVHATVRDAHPEPLAEVELRITALFRFGVELSERDVGTYLSRMGGAMLFPYVREAVHAVSVRTYFGPLLIQPMVLRPLFTDDQIASLKAGPIG